MKGKTRIIKSLLLIAWLMVVICGGQSTAAFNAASSIEIVEVKNLGLSANDNTKSIIQIKWLVEAQPGVTIKSFDVSLDVIYADGAIEKVKTSANGSARFARFELLTLHLGPGKAAAELKNFKATITANTAETTTKSGSLP